jgi:hypothetical protein
VGRWVGGWVGLGVDPGDLAASDEADETLAAMLAGHLPIALNGYVVAEQGPQRSRHRSRGGKTIREEGRHIQAWTNAREFGLGRGDAAAEHSGAAFSLSLLHLGHHALQHLVPIKRVRAVKTLFLRVQRKVRVHIISARSVFLLPPPSVFVSLLPPPSVFVSLHLTLALI